MTDADLIRFVNAQTEVYSQVIEELADGSKRTHWMWFIFPQITGLGHSAMAQRYAIRDLDHARRYLANPILGSRLLHDGAAATAGVRINQAAAAAQGGDAASRDCSDHRRFVGRVAGVWA